MFTCVGFWGDNQWERSTRKKSGLSTCPQVRHARSVGREMQNAIKGLNVRHHNTDICWFTTCKAGPSRFQNLTKSEMSCGEITFLNSFHRSAKYHLMDNLEDGLNWMQSLRDAMWNTAFCATHNVQTYFFVLCTAQRGPLVHGGTQVREGAAQLAFWIWKMWLSQNGRATKNHPSRHGYCVITSFSS